MDWTQAAWMEHLPGGVYRCAWPGKPCFAGESLYRLLDYSAAEVQERFGGDYSCLLHPGDRALYTGTLAALAQEPGQRTLEYRLCKKDGTFHWVCDTIRSVRTEDGTLQAFAVVTDIDCAKREQLRMQALMDTFPGAIVQYRHTAAGLEMTYCNEGTGVLLGYSRTKFAALSDRDPLRMVHEADAAAVTDAVEQALAQDVAAEAVCRLRTPAGLIWTKVRLKTVGREEGQPSVTAVLLNITGEIEAQRQRQWDNERYRLLVEDSDTTTMDYDPASDTLRYCRNGHGKALPQCDLPRFLETIQYNKLFDPQHALLCSDAMTTLCEAPGRCTLELRLRTLESDFHWCRVQLVSIADEQGAVYRIIGRLNDIQAERDRETDLKIAVSREEAYRSALTEGAVLAFIVDGETWRRIPSAGDILPTSHQDNDTVTDFLRDFSAELVHPDDRPVVAALQDRSDSDQEGEDIYVEYRSLSMDGSYPGYRWFGLHRHRLMSTEPGRIHYLIYSRDIHARKEEELALWEKANKDPLTGLINRASFEELSRRGLDAAAESGGTAAFFMVDLDDFKQINDTHGHLVGDQVLQQAALELKSIFRENDLVARLGGDELAVFLTNFRSVDTLHRKAADICRRFSELRIQGRSLPACCSVGIAVFPQNGAEFATLYHHADLALYQAKQSGKNRYCMYGREVADSDNGVWMDKEWLLDTIGALIYISDCQTHDLIYMSKAMCQKFDMGNYRNRKCYEVLQGRDAPCEFCTTDRLSFDDFYCWEYRNPKFDVQSILKDKLIKWNGRTARMEVITEIT